MNEKKKLVKDYAVKLTGISPIQTNNLDLSFIHESDSHPLDVKREIEDQLYKKDPDWKMKFRLVCIKQITYCGPSMYFVD